MIVFVSDIYAKDYVGGAELTTQSIISGTRLPVVQLYSNQVSVEVVDALKDRYWIFGNFTAVPGNVVMHCIKTLKNYSVIEYDYKYCTYRLPEKHASLDGKCECETTTMGKIVSLFFANAKNLWFMSEKQMERYCDKFPFLRKDTTRVLSSTFDDLTLDYILSLKGQEKNDVWLIQDSNSWVKGTSNAIEYAKKHNLKYETFSGLEYTDMLRKFSSSRGFIFLPLGGDTCPRTVIEAKLLGCKLILNDNVQHKDEEWFIDSPETVERYLRNRIGYFWEEITKESDNLPQKTKARKEETHFKIIIPVYNSEKWINKVIESVTDQEYGNYECIVSDDISTDNTWRMLKSIDKTTDEKIRVFKNSEKKYALKNIYDSVLAVNPDPKDVIVVLDGDDWFSNNHVLSKLNECYAREGCLVTYGSFVQFPDGNIGSESSEYPKEVIDNNLYRKDTWRASHLKTFKYGLWKNILSKDLKSTNGEFYEISYDQAMMLPLLEMAGEKARYIQEVLYVYNVGNPNAVNKTRAERQYRNMIEIRAKQPYRRLTNEDISREYKSTK